MGNSSQLLSQVVPFFSGERRTTVNLRIQIAWKWVLYFSRNHQSFRTGLWELNPVGKQVVGDPVHMSICSFASLLLTWIWWSLFLEIKSALSNPVIFLSSIDLSKESKWWCSTHDRQSLQWLLKQESVVFSEIDSSPFQHGCLACKVRNVESSVFS